MRKILALGIFAALAACDMATNPQVHSKPKPAKWTFQMPMVHDTVSEYLFCDDSLANGTACTFRGLHGSYEESGDWSYLDLPDSTIQWPHHDGVGPVFLTNDLP